MNPVFPAHGSTAGRLPVACCGDDGAGALAAAFTPVCSVTAGLGGGAAAAATGGGGAAAAVVPVAAVATVAAVAASGTGCAEASGLAGSEAVATPASTTSSTFGGSGAAED